MELLNAAATDGRWFNEGFPTSSPCPETARVRFAKEVRSQPTAVTDGLQITSPADGSSVEPGQALTVIVEPDAGVTPDRDDAEQPR